MKELCGCPCPCVIIPNLPSSDTIIRCWSIYEWYRIKLKLSVRPPHCCPPTSGCGWPQSRWWSPWPTSPTSRTWPSWPSTRPSWWPGGRTPRWWRSTWAPPVTASPRLSGRGTWPGTARRSKRRTWWWSARATSSSRLASSWSHWKATSGPGYSGQKPPCMEVSQAQPFLLPQPSLRANIRHGLHHPDKDRLEALTGRKQDLRGGAGQVPQLRQCGDHRELDQGGLRQELGVRPEHRHSKASQTKHLHPSSVTSGISDTLFCGTILAGMTPFPLISICTVNHNHPFLDTKNFLPWGGSRQT